MKPRPRFWAVVKTGRLNMKMSPAFEQAVLDDLVKASSLSWGRAVATIGREYGLVGATGRHANAWARRVLRAGRSAHHRARYAKPTIYGHRTEVSLTKKETCAASCYEIAPGVWIHRPWDGCTTLIPEMPSQKLTSAACWHCGGSGECDCVSCGGKCAPCGWVALPEEEKRKRLDRFRR